MCAVFSGNIHCQEFVALFHYLAKKVGSSQTLKERLQLCVLSFAIVRDASQMPLYALLHTIDSVLNILHID